MGRVNLLMILLLNGTPITAATHHPQEFLKRIAGSPDEGTQIVEHYCANCHAIKPMIPIGAPRIGQSTDWEPRLKRGFDVIFKHTDEGLNAMPPRGGCFECSDEQLKLAILALLPEDAKKRPEKIQKEHKKSK